MDLKQTTVKKIRLGKDYAIKMRTQYAQKNEHENK